MRRPLQGGPSLPTLSQSLGGRAWSPNQGSEWQQPRCTSDPEAGPADLARHLTRRRSPARPQRPRHRRSVGWQQFQTSSLGAGPTADWQVGLLGTSSSAGRSAAPGPRLLLAHPHPGLATEPFCCSFSIKAISCAWWGAGGVSTASPVHAAVGGVPQAHSFVWASFSSCPRLGLSQHRLLRSLCWLALGASGPPSHGPCLRGRSCCLCRSAQAHWTPQLLPCSEVTGLQVARGVLFHHWRALQTLALLPEGAGQSALLSWWLVGRLGRLSPMPFLPNPPQIQVVAEF